MKRFNLSAWALGHRSFVSFLMAVALAAGVLAYRSLGREEDPSFAIKTMLVQAQWPGATVQETLDQVTDRIEKELRQIPQLDYVKSFTSPGQATVYVNLKDTTKAADIPWIWYLVRKHIGDIKGDFPSGVQGPAFDDEFGDVYGNVYAVTGDGFSPRQVRDAVEQLRLAIVDVPGLGKTEVVGARDEAIYLDVSTEKLAGLGIDRQKLISTLQEQNDISATGVVQAGPERVSVRVSGTFASEASLRDVNLRVDGKFFRLSDVGAIRRTYEDPPRTLFRVDGEPAVGLAVGMRAGSNVVAFGEALHRRIREAEARLPVGMAVEQVSDQPAIVEASVDGFVKALVESIVIVLAVSFVSLGLRAGLVVSLSIPLVLAATFVVMAATGVALQRISLGALIIALGLLVDDAMITTEMMVARLEAGDAREDAATYAYHSTAFPMLTGTLVTVASFIPIGFNGSSAGEYTFSLFVVLASSLLISWLVAVLFAPLLGAWLLPRTLKRHDGRPGLAARLFRRALLGAMRGRWLTVGTTLALFALAVVGLRAVQQQFFPSSDRPALLVDLTLPQSSTIADTEAQVGRLEEILANDGDVSHFTSYVGEGAVRFYLSLDPQPSDPFFAQLVVDTPDLAARGRVMARLERAARDRFVGTDVFVHTLELGPPVGRPVQYRLSGPDIQGVRERAVALMGVVGADPHLAVPTLDWNEPGKVLRVEVVQDKARALGITSQDLAGLFNSITGGADITRVVDSIYLVPISARAEDRERTSLDTFSRLQVPLSNGSVVPLLAFATLRYGVEQPLVWRRDRLPTATVRAVIRDAAQAPTVVAELAPAVAAFRSGLPAGYRLETGGTVEESAKGQGPIVAVVPLMLLAMAFVLMVQLQSGQKLFIAASAAPLGLVGVVAALLLSGRPLGFVAILGVLALIGIIIRNSVILVVQIDEYEREGRRPWDAVVEATCHRMRPILLTAAAASLAMVPIAFEVFWGPMAFAMIGGILAATALTLLFLPALYVGWYRIREDDTPGGARAPSELEKAA